MKDEGMTQTCSNEGYINEAIIHYLVLVILFSRQNVMISTTRWLPCLGEQSVLHFSHTGDLAMLSAS